MTTEQPQVITVAVTVNAPVQKVWDYWTTPEHIIKWNAASDDWHTTKSENDVRKGGKFSSRMEAKDGSFGFDFGGEYDEVIPQQHIAFSMGDGRKVAIDFAPTEQSTTITQRFDAEKEHSIEMQKGGWQAIMDNFKKYTETH